MILMILHIIRRRFIDQVPQSNMNKNEIILFRVEHRCLKAIPRTCKTGGFKLLT
jgi:hypothetical protein